MSVSTPKPRIPTASSLAGVGVLAPGATPAPTGTGAEGKGDGVAEACVAQRPKRRRACRRRSSTSSARLSWVTER